MGGRGSKSSRENAGAAGGGGALGAAGAADRWDGYMRASGGSKENAMGMAASRGDRAALEHGNPAKPSGGGSSKTHPGTGAAVKPGFEATHTQLASRGVKIGNTAYKGGKPIGRITHIGNKGSSMTVQRPRSTVSDGRGGSRGVGGDEHMSVEGVTGK